jgi:hypothetical protein
MKGASRDASAPPVALWATLLFLFVTNGVTLFALTTLNLRYDQLQADCAAELKDRDTLLRTAAVEADKTDVTIEACHNSTRQAAGTCVRVRTRTHARTPSALALSLFRSRSL